MDLLTLPQQLKPVLLFSGAANAVTCDTVSLKNVLKFWWLIFHAGANDTDLTLTPTQATDVASATNKATTTTHRIWTDLDAGTTSDTLVQRTAAASLTIDPATWGIVNDPEAARMLTRDYRAPYVVPEKV